MFKKREHGSTVDRLPDPSDKTVVDNKAILDYVFAHAKDDKRPYLNVTIFGKTFLGLLDSGCTTTVIGALGWKALKDLCALSSTETRACSVANGETCKSIGWVRLPIQLRDRVKILNVLVIPSIPHELILGVDFWSAMKIIPDLFTNEWSFRSDQQIVDREIAAIRSIDSLTEPQRKILTDVIDDAFSKIGDKLGCTDLVELTIRTNAAPIKQRYYPISPALQKDVNAELEAMLADDIIEPSTSPWSSPIIMVKKPDGRWRFCVDYRALNKVSIPDAYPLPFVTRTLDKLRDARYLTTLDIKSAYWQIKVAKESRPLTAFTVPTRGLFQFKRMPFGIHSAPAVWQRLIDQVIGVDLEQYVFVYLDDVIVCTPTFDLHVQILKEVLSRIIKAGLTLNRDKCDFCKSELKYLGYVVNSSGLLVDPDKVDAILRIPSPRNVRDVRHILGLASWYRRFIPNFSTVAAPITALTQKNKQFFWTTECEQALTCIKECLISAPVLACPNFDLPFTVQTDASDYGLGAILSQVQDGAERVICYLSRSLNKAERKYTTTEKECLAVLFAIEKFRPYIEGTKFTVVTDHYSLKWLYKIKDPVGRIARWAVRLQQYDFDIVHRPGKNHTVPDALSRAVPVINSLSDINVFTDVTDKWYLNLLRQVTERPQSYPMWMVENNQLYKLSKPQYPELSGTSWLCVVPKESRKKIIHDHHDPPLCGHLGISKTCARIAEHFYWPKLKTDVANYIRKCTTCLETKPDQKRPIGKMLSAQPTAQRPWQLVSADLVGPLPRSRSGYVYILSVLDCFSKFILLFPLRSAKGPALCKALEDHVFLIFGAPETLIVDNGPQFRSHSFRALLENYQVKVSYTANYHPQANPVERHHRVVKTMLSAYVKDNHPQWEKYLNKVGAAMRSSKSDVTQLTPNFVNYGREVYFSGSRNDPPTDTPAISAYDDPKGVSVALNKVFKDVQKRLKDAYNRTKIPYNLRRRDERFHLGQMVWKKNYVLSDATRKFTGKLAPKYIGPYKISQVLSPWTYELTDPSGRLVGTWHGKDLKAHPPDDSENDSPNNAT